jgi:hypothetical protein
VFDTTEAGWNLKHGSDRRELLQNIEDRPLDHGVGDGGHDNRTLLGGATLLLDSYAVLLFELEALRTELGFDSTEIAVAVSIEDFDRVTGSRARRRTSIRADYPPRVYKDASLADPSIKRVVRHCLLCRDPSMRPIPAPVDA